MLVTTGLRDQVDYTACAKMGKWNRKSVCVCFVCGRGKPGVIKVTRRREWEEIISHVYYVT